MEISPAVSVVVATHERADLLAGLVQALEEQEDAGPFELVIVDDASTDDTWLALQRLESETKLPMVPLRLACNSGPAVARNVGWRAAKAPLIVFTDDDCRPHPGWIAAIRRRSGEADIVQGRTLPDPEHDDHWALFGYTIKVEGEWGYYEACNIAYRRDLLERLGGFDERFQYSGRRPRGVGPIYGEDVDLAWRAKDEQARIVFEPEAIVFHEIRRRTLVEHLLDLRRREGIPIALRKNPRLRERCHYRWFWMRSHPPALLAAGGILAAASKPRSVTRVLVGLGLTLPYANYRTRVRPIGRRREWPLMIPIAFLTDLAEIGVFAWASARHRVLVL